MSNAPIRTAQLVTPFGPGSLYTNTDGHVLLIAGLDQWFTPREGGELKKLSHDEMAEFIISEPRLSKLLGGVMFRRAPDYRRPVRNQQASPNANLTVPCVRFPTWYRRQSGKDSGRLQQATYFIERETNPKKGTGAGSETSKWEGRWVPVRFATACEHGHLNEFPWKQWAQCECEDSSGLRLEDRGGTGLESITVHCETCPTGSPGRKGRSLQGLTHLPEDENADAELGRAGIVCSGGIPWLGNFGKPCGSKRLVAVLLNQSNLYIGKTASSLKLPDPDDIQDDVQKVIEFIRDKKRTALHQRVVMRWQMGQKEKARGNVLDAMQDDGVEMESQGEKIDVVLQILCGERAATEGAARPSGPEAEEIRFRREEFDLLCRETPKKSGLPLRVVAAETPQSLREYISQISRVEKLTEVRAMCGFSRLKEQQYGLGEVKQRVEQQLYRQPADEIWLPAVQVSGEGIFVRLSEDEFNRWYERNQEWLERRLDRNLVERMALQHRLMAPSASVDHRWAARFMLTHTFSHILINQLVFESGYSSAALRERLYVSPDAAAPMMALLIYTAQGDSEGTLGGLVNLGHPDRFEAIVMRALAKASWCSADPVCSESGASGAKRVNLAACHACSLLPETACETINDGLDRGVVVGTPDARHAGYFSGLLGGGV